MQCPATALMPSRSFEDLLVLLFVYPCLSKLRQILSSLQRKREDGFLDSVHLSNLTCHSEQL